MILQRLKLLLVVLLITNGLIAQTTEGELKRWHKITLTFDGPNTAETATPNPFLDYRLQVTFTHSTSNRSYVVQGYYAACGNAKENSCDSGNKWRVHFAPDQTGVWNWTASFVSGANVAINGGGSDAGFMNGATGILTIAESDKTGRDFRNKNLGRLKYVGEHYLQHMGTNPSDPNGPWFVKAGADAPENTLAYDDFDNTPNRGNWRKSWNPHQQDYIATEASQYTWKSGKGTELLGVVNYLATKGVNAFSFLTLSLHGDDENVFPHALKVPVDTYNGYGDEQQWNDGVHKDRFDVSKLEQWEQIFAYADQKGMYLHFKTMETENDNMMDNNTFGNQRKLYYRELIARFGHHLALNWNLTEESTIPDNVVIATADYIASIDPYHHHIVLHTYPGQQDERYTPLLGNQSELTGVSIQIGKNRVHNEVKEWIEKSNGAGKKWIVANDEQGSANVGVDKDPNDRELVRNDVLWGTLMAGGAGVEYYYGYQTGETDLSAQDHRSRDQKYTDAARALDFFNTYLQEYIIDMVSADNVTSDSEDYVFAKVNEIYVVYRPNGGTTGLTLPSGNTNYQVQWYNPRDLSALSSATTLGNNLEAPDTNDWVALITRSNGALEPIDIPGVVEAENYIDQSGVQVDATSDVGGGSHIGYINNGDYTVYDIDVATTAKYNVSARVASNTNGGTIVIKSNGSTVGELNVSNTGGWQSWTTVATQVDLTAGEQTLRLDFVGGSGSLFDINKLEFTEHTDTGGNDECAALEQNGVAAVEAEHFVSQSNIDKRQWYVQDGTATTPEPDPDPSHHDSASGGGYLEILPDTRVTHDDQLIAGTNFTNTAGAMAIIDYKVKFTTPGRYFVFVRAYSTGTEDNGVHVGINGTWPASGNRMQWCAGKNQWTWESKQRTAANHCGEEEKIYIDVPSAGIHTISFSMREDGFEMDKFVLTQTYTKPNGAGPDEVLVNCNLSVDDNELSSVYLSPNPTEAFIHIHGVSKGDYAIYDMIGRKMSLISGTVESANHKVDVSSLPSGMYFVTINDGNKEKTLKFLKR